MNGGSRPWRGIRARIRNVSLKAKLFLTLLTVLAIAHVSLGYVGYYNLAEQSERHAQERLSGLPAVMDALLAQSMGELARLAAQAAGSEHVAKLSAATPLQMEELHPELLSNIDEILFFSLDGVSLRDGVLDHAARDVARTHAPQWFVRCASVCTQQVYVPAFDKDSLEIVVRISRQISEILLTFRKLTGTDVAVLARADASGEGALLWGWRQLEVTDAPRLLPQLRRLAQLRGNLPADGQRAHVRVGDDSLVIEASPIRQSDKGTGVRMLYIVDESVGVRQIAESVRKSAFITLAGMLISGLALFLLLTPAARRLERVTQALPLLAEQRFVDARALIGVPRNAKGSDEIDRLDAAARKLAERLERLNAAESANEAKSSFLAAMSHEIRTPMNGVLGMLELFERSRLDAQQRESVVVMRDSAFSLLRVIDDILDVSKIEANKIALESHPFSVAEILEGCMETLSAVASAKDVKLFCFADPGMPARLIGDAVRLRQVLFNLVGNAIKFTPKGRVLVTITSELREGGHCRLRCRVIDDGIGIRAETIQQLFHPFQQAETSTTRRFGGTGLGLSICKGLMERMGGQIGCQSDLGKGSEFWFLLELPVDASASEPDNVLASALDGVRISVDIGADDETAMLKAYLAASGAVFVPAADADVCLAEQRADAAATRPAAVVLGTRRGDAQIVLCHPISRRELIRQTARLSRDVSPGVAPNAAAHLLLGEFTEPDPAATPAPQSPVRILVAEDHPTNRRVIQRQLALLGYGADIAGDGDEAWRMVQAGTYGLLITDLHMPGRDGYALTQAIRTREADEGLPRLPIVAATANALRGEAERCRSIGMDDYLSKPFSLADLGEALRRWVRAPADASPAEPPVDMAALSDMLGGEPALLHGLFEEFAAANDPAMAELGAAAARHDLPRIEALAHRLLGSARTLAAPELSGVLQALQDLAAAGASAAVLASQYGRAELAYARVRAYVLATPNAD